MKRALRWGLVALLILLVAAAAGALWARGALRGSLPQLDGSYALPGLSAAVTVERDGLGIPTVRGGTREDVARATGFLHAQDRYFQMDLARRRAAGELSGLVGARALAADREIRLHRFRPQAQRAVGLLQPGDRALLDAYTAGVNAGFAALASPPFEYLMLRVDPAPWRPEDTLLVVLSMFVTLQDDDASYESTLATMHDVLPQEMFDFLAPRGTEWDSPIVGDAFVMPAPPGAEIYNLRAKRAGRPTRPRRSGRNEAGLGSNNFAVSAAHSSNGAALVANDMHLGIRVPNTWYRMSLEWPDPERPEEPHRLIGTTLPGVPALVTGSNTHVAWGFTNTYGDWGDIVLLEIDPGNPERYLTPDGWRTFDRFREIIDIAGQAAAVEEVRWTIWGPVLPPDPRGRMRAFRWVAHSAERLAAGLTPMESAQTLEEAFDNANGLGTPGQNFVAADRSGRIGWTIYGSIPRRVGLDGQLPTSWADGSRGWQGWLADAEYPRVIDPPSGRIWTANARVVDGEGLARIGDGSFEVGSRARVIRDRLGAKEQFSASDLLDIQLDTRAVFLERWKALLIDVLSPAAIDAHPQRRALRELLETGWTGHAVADSAAYRFVRTFRDFTSERVFSFVLAECYEADAVFDYNTVRRREGPLWALVTERPMHLLDPAYADWESFLLETADVAIEAITRDRDGPLADRVWSEANVTAYRHPLSGAVPFLGRWLDMPFVPLPGDLYTPQVALGAVGASERMVVSPGREAEGIMHMPTGQSGHPLSPFYGNSHGAWVDGRATPFLPGPARHTLVLAPGSVLKK
ncbi:MAG: penicillin acylase family protein [Vicinamibacterales bacterium]